jgi:tRNA uridine 5-carboxymethylaminomethyl modification enzyme
MAAATRDLLVVGAGHAGVEAAAAAARLGARVAVVTLSLDTVAQMPCNPAMGGIGKGHLMAELDALGGVQPWAADRAGLQFKVLNRSRGPAVWGPRAQCDKQRYTVIMRRLLQRLAGIDIIEGEVSGLLDRAGRVVGVRLADGRRLEATAVLLTTGTFLDGILHTGAERRPGGRFGERPSVGLGADLRARGLELRRFKTGTPPRLHRASIDVERLQPEPGDAEPRPFSWRTRSVANRVLCWLAHTPEVVQSIIADNLHRSPLFSGQIQGVGPRYCPSIEDKVVRFPHHRQHTVFLEPEGLDCDSMYVNGLSTSLPADVQEQVVRAIPGFERARFLRYGYAVEYDVVAPLQVAPTLECRSLPGLFVAGQLLGTSGYEEAAALGFVSGVNAVLLARGEAPFVPERERSYLGVLVDDLCSVDNREPYRMLTSRAEHRLLLGVDSARERLMPHGARLGLIPEAVFHVEQERWRRRREVRDELATRALNPDPPTRALVRRIAGVEPTAPTTWAGILRRQDVDAETVAAALPVLSGLTAEDRRAVLGGLRYDGYLARHQREVERLARLRHLEIPSDLEPADIPGLSREAADALRRHRPRTVADAERLPGVTPAAVAILIGRLSRARDALGRPSGSIAEGESCPES